MRNNECSEVCVTAENSRSNMLIIKLSEMTIMKISDSQWTDY